MKRIYQLIVVVALALTATAFAQDQKVIGVSIPAADHGWTAGVVYWANQAKAQVEEAYPNLSIIVKTAKDPAEQANQIQDLVTVNKIDALVILPYESAPLTKPVADVKKQGVFVVVVDRGLTDPSIQDVYVAGDNPGMGRVSGEYVAQKLGGNGQIVVLRGIPTVIDNQRYDAFMEVMKQHPGIKVLDAQYANWNRDDGFKVMQDFLTRFPKIDAVWAQDDDIAVGVLRAIQQANRSDIQFVLGGAGMKEFVKMVMDGDPLVPADVLYPPNMVDTAINVAAMHYVSGSAVLGTYIVAAPLVTKDNAAQYYFPNSPF
ncbi:MAG TPA: ABC transporter substrate-binding protein [Trueperaceae bacterium]|nr:ABC transporter substrate-binding protein [Trueperaceae bacterium]